MHPVKRSPRLSISTSSCPQLWQRSMAQFSTGHFQGRRLRAGALFWPRSSQKRDKMPILAALVLNGSSVMCRYSDGGSLAHHSVPPKWNPEAPLPRAGLLLLGYRLRSLSSGFLVDCTHVTPLRRRRDTYSEKENSEGEVGGSDRSLRLAAGVHSLACLPGKAVRRP